MTLKAGEKATLSIQSSGNLRIRAPQATIAVTVQPTNQMIPIQLSFAN